MSRSDALLLEPYRDPKEVWFALRTDNTAGCGSESDPWDAKRRQSKAIDVESLVSTVVTQGVVARASTGPVNHGFEPGDLITIANAVNPGSDDFYNGTFRIHAKGIDGGDHYFEYFLDEDPDGDAEQPAEGSITCYKHIFPLDQRMATMPANTAVHLGPGVFETLGHAAGFPGGWQPHSGQRIAGSGIQVTIVKLVGASVGDSHLRYKQSVSEGFSFVAIASDANLAGFEALDFTVDCNLSGQRRPVLPKWPDSSPKGFARVATAAIHATGLHIRLRRIHAIGFGTQAPGVESFVLASGGVGGQDCVIQDCIAEKPSENNVYTTTVMQMGSGFHRSCAIRDCYVNCEYADGVSSHFVSVRDIVPVDPENPGTEWKVITWGPHRRQQGNNIVLAGVKQTVVINEAPVNIPSAAFMGSFVVEAVESTHSPEDTVRISLPTVPEEELVISGAAIGVTFQAFHGAAGTGTVIEGNRVQHATTGVYHDTGSTREMIVRKNWFHDVRFGVVEAMGSADVTHPVDVNLAYDGQNVTATTAQPHGLISGAAVAVFDATLGALNGNYPIHVPALPGSGGPSPTAFEYRIDLSGSGVATGKYVEFFRVHRLIIEDNVIELAEGSQNDFSPLIAISVRDATNEQLVLNVFLSVTIRRNTIASAGPSPASKIRGIFIDACQAALVEKNLIDLPGIEDPVFRLFHERSGRVKYFDNRTSDGTLIRGIDRNDIFKPKAVDELATVIDDAILLSFI